LLTRKTYDNQEPILLASAWNQYKIVNLYYPWFYIFQKRTPDNIIY